MTRFSELMMTNEVHSAFEGEVVDTAPASVEDSVIGPHNIHLPEILQRVNGFVGSIADREFVQPEAAFSQLETRLRTIGVQLKDSISIEDKKGTFESGLSFNGGRFGKDTDGSDINDDGLTHKVGKELKLKGIEHILNRVWCKF